MGKNKNKETNNTEQTVQIECKLNYSEKHNLLHIWAAGGGHE